MASHLKRYLEEHGISQYRLQKATGMSTDTMYRLMRTDHIGRLSTWESIADALGCTIDEILKWGDGDGGELCGEGSEADKRDNRCVRNE